MGNIVELSILSSYVQQLILNGRERNGQPIHCISLECMALHR